MEIDPVNAIWELNANIRLLNGSTLVLDGASIGGDVNQLRMDSQPRDRQGLRLHRRRLRRRGDQFHRHHFLDSTVNGPDTNFEDGRAYIAVSPLMAADGVTPLDSRMDILNSNTTV